MLDKAKQKEPVGGLDRSSFSKEVAAGTKSPASFCPVSWRTPMFGQ
jgi:hypothetical protein